MVGHNGVGKSTLLRVLTGQLAPLAGRVWRGGTPVAWLPQRTDVRTPISVRALVLLGRYRHKRWYAPWLAADFARAEAALARCGIAHLAARDFQTLSGGEQQLVWLAQLWVQDAPLCLLDEPTQQLDVYHRRRVFDLLADWVLREGRAVVVVTHDLANLAALPAALPARLLNLSPAPSANTADGAAADAPAAIGAETLTPATVGAALAALEGGPPHQ